MPNRHSMGDSLITSHEEKLTSLISTFSIGGNFGRNVLDFLVIVNDAETAVIQDLM